MRSRAGCHVSGEDVVRVAVQVLAGRVVPRSGARVGVPGGDLDVAEVGKGCVDHGRGRAARSDRGNVDGAGKSLKS